MRHVFAAFLIAALTLPASAAQVPQSPAQVQLTFAPIVKRVAPAVVNVYARSVVQTQTNPLFADPFFQRFFGASPEFRQRVQQSLGSGVIVRADGVILTNNHVIENGQDIVVALSDRREFKAKVLLADSHTDLAVLKIDTKGERLPTVDFGDSDHLQVGDLVLAIGDPFGVGQTVTMGIVSALARTQISASDYQLVLHPDGCRHQSRQFRRRAGDDRRQAGRHQHGNLFAHGRVHRHRLCDPCQSRTPRRGRRVGRRRQASLVRR
jgi:S1-C subfamily serine protease